MPEVAGVSGVAPMTSREFARLRELIHETCGIALRDTKRDLLASRLSKRLRHHGLGDYSSYLDLVTGPHADPTELTALVNCITTNKTDFFREPHHFDMLRSELVPQWIERARRGAPQRVRLWSAGCSTGEEPYTIAMALHDVLPARMGWDVEILATDIDSDVLARAAAGVYAADRLSGIPAAARNHFTRTDRGYAVSDEIRERVTFRQLNLIAAKWPMPAGFDAIFCRNVIIYFDRPTQQRLFSRFTRLLAPTGRIFIGHSESLNGISDELVLEGHTVYRKRDPSAASPPSAATPASTISASMRALKKGVHSIPPPPPPPTAATPAAATVERLIVGDVRASARNVRMTTVLGSCLSVCLFDPVAQVGGMNHFLLPSPPDGEAATARYGTVAMAELVEQTLAAGASRHRLQAKLFGASTGDADPAAAANIEFARAYLASQGIPILVERVGRPHPLELHFFVRGGAAKFRELPLVDCKVKGRRR